MSEQGKYKISCKKGGVLMLCDSSEEYAIQQAKKQAEEDPKVILEEVGGKGGRWIFEQKGGEEVVKE